MKDLDLRVRIAMAIAAGGALAALGLPACGSDTENATGSSDAGEAGKNDAADGGGSTGSDASGGGDSATDEDTGTENDAASNPDVIPTPRRPFLIGAELRSAEAVVGLAAWSARDAIAPVHALDVLDAKTRDLLARAWLDDALQEHASVAAFARFTMLLLAVGAPPELVIESQRASLDEISHARDCFALARRYGSEATEPGGLGIAGALGNGDVSLRAVVRLAVEEGCVGETLGAAIAEEQLRVATDPEVRRVLARIARDEARHAELAWKFVAWACAKAPALASEVTAAIERGVRATRALPVRPLPLDDRTWRAHGRLPCIEARRAAERAIDEILLPSVQRLAARAQARKVSLYGTALGMARIRA